MYLVIRENILNILTKWIKNHKILSIFFAGLIEQFGFTLYIIAVDRYLILVSSVLMFIYFYIYLLLMKYCVKDDKNTAMLAYALAGAIGNALAMMMHLVK